MSSSRYAAEDSELSQNRYASDPAFVGRRGISGSAVAAKASLLPEAESRSLLYFLQSLSLSRNGLREVAREIIEMFPERIGTDENAQTGLEAWQTPFLLRRQVDRL